MSKKRLTKKRAKILTLKVWRYLAEHPECEVKSKLPKKLYSLIVVMQWACPLCELFFPRFKSGRCSGCPLYESKNGCMNVDGSVKKSAPFRKWDDWNSTDRVRANAAKKIVKIVEQWEV
jgi:hypothetical protein